MHADTSTGGYSALAGAHPVFAELLRKNGDPPGWRRPPTFATLTRLVLEQQVSLASANAAFNRLETRIGSVSPSNLLTLNDDELRRDGFSRQKAGYVRGIAEMIEASDLDLEAISRLEKEDAIERLVAIRGVGRWTASCFVLFVNGAPDVWPTGDRALYVSMSRVLGLDGVPDRESCDHIATAWSPYRSAAARMLWHDYLGGKNYEPTDSGGFIDGEGIVSR
ncbi:MAG: DNA-3-methyladenine glycosylase 2 family protein [Armatimonadetes bacterium]|nr:MAG: DNA-3-methyladenine glycosylase 2 family protein [Armatimonadota bacterium]